MYVIAILLEALHRQELNLQLLEVQRQQELSLGMLEQQLTLLQLELSQLEHKPDLKVRQIPLQQEVRLLQYNLR